MGQERLQKIIAQAGFASRRAAEKLIVDGRVRVNGKVVQELGAKADPRVDKIELDGHGTLRREPLVYIALYKPPGVVSTVNDPEGRTTVVDLLDRSRALGQRMFEGNMPRVYPVGRLDFDAEGLLLLTNDGELTNRVLHPRRHVPKTYMVRVRGIPLESELERLRKGVRLKETDGSLSSRSTRPAEARCAKKGRTNAWVELVIMEGRNHQVKRMCEVIGHPVNRLIRTDFGGIPLEPLQPGQWRFLDDSEVEQLRGWDPDRSGRRPPAQSARPQRRPQAMKVR